MKAVLKASMDINNTTVKADGWNGKCGRHDKRNTMKPLSIGRSNLQVNGKLVFISLQDCERYEF